MYLAYMDNNSTWPKTTVTAGYECLAGLTNLASSSSSATIFAAISAAISAATANKGLCHPTYNERCTFRMNDFSQCQLAVEECFSVSNFTSRFHISAGH
jgi:hypothetical protein